MPNAHVATEPVEPLGPPEPVGDLFSCHAEAGIPLRVLDNLWPSASPWYGRRPGGWPPGPAPGLVRELLVRLSPLRGSRRVAGWRRIYW